MENQNEKQNNPMTDKELDLFLQDVSHQVEEATEKKPAKASVPRSGQRKPPKKKSKKSKKMSRRTLNILWILLVLIFSAVFIISATVYIKYKVDSNRRQNEDENRVNIKESIQAAVQATNPSEKPTTPDPIPTYPGGLPINPPTEPTAQTILPEYLPFFEQNPDLVGWIEVPGTKINYPVVQSMPDNKDFYIDHDFMGRPRGAGAIYVRESCDVFMPSDNVTIYGHHMKDMTMFAGLDYYWEKSWWETHQTFTFDTIFEHHTYQVFAVFRTSANIGEGFSYHQFENAATEKEFDLFVDTVKTLSRYDTGITPQYGDKLVCLSTCEYSMNNGRLVVVAKRIS